MKAIMVQVLALVIWIGSIAALGHLMGNKVNVMHYQGGVQAYLNR